MNLNLFLLCLTGLVPVAVFIQRTVPHHYDLIMTKMTWPDARNYCKEIYDDLATILSDTDWLRLKKVAASKGLTAKVWTGLYDDINSWRWSLNNLPLENVTYKAWYSGQPDNYYGKQACAIIGLYNKWWDMSCTGLRPFICYNASLSGTDSFIGINYPELSWFDAQTYCRTHHTDLASSLNSSDNNMLVQIKNVQGDSWIGLYRDTWKWPDGTIASNIPWASGEPSNAGGIEDCAMLYNTKFYDVPCTYNYYFFCHTIFPTRSQIMRLQIKSDGSVFDSAVQSSMLEQIKQKLNENGTLENITVTWKVQPDGEIFHKKNKDDL